jgi:predicted phage terminase large subunit-like protein
VLDEFRFPEDKLSKISRRMTAWAVAGQLQQRPTVRGGQIFPVANIKVVESFYSDHVGPVVRYWDKAGTEGGGKRTAGVKIAKMIGGAYDFLVMDVVKGQWEYGNRENRIKQTAQLDGLTVKIYVEQEPGSGGKESVQNTIRKTLQGFTAYGDRATGDKFVRMEPLAAAVENGRVAVLQRPWTKAYLDELEDCGPGAAFVDQADATAGGFNKLNDSKEAGVWGR